MVMYSVYLLLLLALLKRLAVLLPCLPGGHSYLRSESAWWMLLSQLGSSEESPRIDGGLQDIVIEETDDKCVSTMISHFRLKERKVERTETRKVTKLRQSITLSCSSLLLVFKLLLFIFDRMSSMNGLLKGSLSCLIVIYR